MSEEKIYFPNITPPSWPFDEEPEDTSVISKFEDGNQQSRSQKTRSRRKWTLKWKNISREEYLILMHFIKHVVKFSAESFYWLNPDSIDDDYQYMDPDQEVVEVRITHVGKWTNEGMRYWSGTLELTEV